MKQLSPKARAMLDALQTVDSPAADIETRAWSAVVARTAAGDLGPTIPADPAMPVAATAGIGKTLVIAVGVAAVAAAIAVGIASAGDDEEVAPVQRMLGHSTPTLPAPRIEATAESEPVIVAEAAPEIAPAIVAAPTKAPRVRAKAEPSKPVPADDGPDALEREMRLMSEARAALGAGDAARAIGLLKDHAKEFPHGAFVLEREVSWITALCALGKTDAARTRASAFLRKHEKHPLAAKVRASCGGTTP
jgi:hypothetical protein